MLILVFMGAEIAGKKKRPANSAKRAVAGRLCPEFPCRRWPGMVKFEFVTAGSVPNYPSHELSRAWEGFAEPFRSLHEVPARQVPRPNAPPYRDRNPARPPLQPAAAAPEPAEPRGDSASRRLIPCHVYDIKRWQCCKCYIRRFCAHLWGIFPPDWCSQAGGIPSDLAAVPPKFL